MRTRSLSPKIAILVLGDIAVCFLALASALFLRYGGAPEAIVIDLYRFAAPLLVALWLTGFLMFGLYDEHFAKNDPAFFERLAKTILFNFAATAFLFYAIPEFGLRPILSLIVIFLTLAAFFFVWRSGYNAILARRTKEQVLFVGINDEAVELAGFFDANPQLGFSTAGYLAIDNSAGTAPPGVKIFPSGTGLPTLVRERGITRIVAIHDIKKTGDLARSLFAVLPLGVTVSDFPRFYEAARGRVPTSLISEGWFIENLIGSKRPRYEFVKRILDLILALAFGAITLILLPLIAAAMIISMPRDIINYRAKRARKGDGIIFFHQARVGRGGRIFNFVKFRSQVLGAERLGREKTTGEDPRAYRVGTILRKTYLDELPQIWNVLIGEMSFVGPRPERPEFARELSGDIPFYHMRELVLPGITGWAQINMKNDASVSDAPEKMQYDLYYIKNRTLALDIAILVKTALKLLQRSGR